MCEELLTVYKIRTDDIRDLKRSCWQTLYYSSLLQAAIYKLNEAHAIEGKWLSAASFAVGLSAAWLIMKYQDSIIKERGHIDDDIKPYLTEYVRGGLDKDKKSYWKDFFNPFMIIYLITIPLISISVIWAIEPWYGFLRCPFLKLWIIFISHCILTCLLLAKYDNKLY